MNFSSFALDARILARLQEVGFVQPTPIQQQTLPHGLGGRDVVGLAQTGTGKTAAFVLPILQRLTQGPRRVPRALILAPTRELAQQIHSCIMELGGAIRPRSVPIYGGVSQYGQNEGLRQGGEIIVACPGRLLDHISQGTINFSHLEILVLDEADMMFDMGFIHDIRRIIRCLPSKRQTMLFSATFPEEVSKLAREILKSPERVEVSNTRPAETVAHAFYPVLQHLKARLLDQVLQKITAESVLVFVRTKHRAERLAKQLQRDGRRVASLQGNLSQNRRREAMDGFRSGKYDILVATDIAARGLDISSVTHVINFDMPDTVEAYTHRIGRTGRAASEGDAFTFVTPEDRAEAAAIEKLLGKKIERIQVEGFDYTISKTEVQRAEKKSDKSAPPESRNSDQPRRPRPPKTSKPRPSTPRAPRAEVHASERSGGYAPNRGGAYAGDRVAAGAAPASADGAPRRHRKPGNPNYRRGKGRSNSSNRLRTNP